MSPSHGMGMSFAQYRALEASRRSNPMHIAWLARTPHGSAVSPRAATVLVSSRNMASSTPRTRATKSSSTIPPRPVERLELVPDSDQPAP